MKNMIFEIVNSHEGLRYVENEDSWQLYFDEDVYRFIILVTLNLNKGNNEISKYPASFFYIEISKDSNNSKPIRLLRGRLLIHIHYMHVIVLPLFILVFQNIYLSLLMVSFGVFFSFFCFLYRYIRLRVILKYIEKKYSNKLYG